MRETKKAGQFSRLLPKIISHDYFFKSKIISHATYFELVQKLEFWEFNAFTKQFLTKLTVYFFIFHNEVFI